MAEEAPGKEEGQNGNSTAVTAAFGVFGNSLLAAGDGPDPEMEAKLAKSIRSMNDFYGMLIKEIGGK